MEAVSFDDALQQADQVIFEAMMQKANILAEARKNTPAKHEWSKLLSRNGLSPQKAKTYIEIAESSRITYPAIRSHLRPDVDLAATGHIVAMQAATFEQWRNKYERRTWNKVVDLRDFREKIEPTPRQLEKKARLEEEQKARVEQYRARREAEEREKLRPRTMLDPPSPSQKGERYETSLKFTFAVEHEEGGWPFFNYDINPRRLKLTDERLAVQVDADYESQCDPNQAVLLIPREEVRRLSDHFVKVALEIERIQRESDPTIRTSRTDIKHLETPLDQYLDSLWEQPQRTKATGSKLCRCGKPISTNKERCQKCGDSANLATAGAQETRHAIA